MIAFSISFETDYVNMARMLQMSGVPVWSKDRTERDPLIVMGGAASFLNPEPIAEFTDVIGVGEGEILGPKLVDAIFENDSKEELGYLSISTMTDPEICEYPDSGKIISYDGKWRHSTEAASGNVDYWKGEL